MRFGLSSFTFTWAVGVPGSEPARPLSAAGIVDLASGWDVPVVQLADNLPLDGWPDAALDGLRATAQARGVALEVGTRGISPELLTRYAEIAGRLGSPIVRTIADTDTDTGTGRHEPAEIVRRLRPLESAYRDRGLVLAIENHDGIPAAELAGIVTALGDWTGICLDTVNSFAALDDPRRVIETLAPLAVNVHLKDFAIVRATHRMGFGIEGRALGDGMLDLDAVLRAVADRPGLTGVVELWTPPQKTLEATIALEHDWAHASIRFLQSRFGCP